MVIINIHKNPLADFIESYYMLLYMYIFLYTEFMLYMQTSDFKLQSTKIIATAEYQARSSSQFS